MRCGLRRKLNPFIVEQQSTMCLYRLREGIKEDRTACINRIRGLLAEFGLVFAQGARELQLIRKRLAEAS